MQADDYEDMLEDFVAEVPQEYDVNALGQPHQHEQLDAEEDEEEQEEEEMEERFRQQEVEQWRPGQEQQYGEFLPAGSQDQIGELFVEGGATTDSGFDSDDSDELLDAFPVEPFSDEDEDDTTAEQFQKGRDMQVHAVQHGSRRLRVSDITSHVGFG